MTDNEFDLLDELYFLQSYPYLVKTLNMSEDVIHSTLDILLKKGWIKCYISPTEEIDFDISKFEKEYWNYHYLATKAGLLAHNSNY